MLKGVKQLIKDVEPHSVLHLGDLIDCWQISDFDKDISRVDSLADNIAEATEFLSALQRAAPKAEFTLLEGNHEDRLRRAIWRAQGPMREIAKLPIFQKAVAWPKLLSLDVLGYRWVGLSQQSRTRILPKIITKHGTAVTKWSANTAKQEYMKYGRSGISGHTHRLGAFYHKDHNGRSTWIEAGCTCDLTPVYCDDPDWQHGAVILRWSADRRVMGEQIVGFRDGQYVL